MAALEEACDAGEAEACEALSREEEAKRRWLARLDVPSWGKAASAVSELASQSSARDELVQACDEGQVEACDTLSREEEAKRAWLARLDAPSWGQAAKAMAEAARQAAEVEALAAGCDSGDDEACDILSREEEAKRRWLARLDAPSWGAAAAGVADVASSVEGAPPTFGAPPARMSEEEAKRAWLARLDQPSWGRRPASASPAPSAASPLPRVEDSLAAASAGRLTEEEAKRAWLARLDAPSWQRRASAPPPAERSSAALPEESPSEPRRSEEEAKRAWLARLDANSSAYRLQTNASSIHRYETEASSDGRSNLSASGVQQSKLARIQQAKQAWLARLKSPAKAQGVRPAVSPRSLSAMDVERAWTARLDAKTWEKVATLVSNLAEQARELAALEEACDTGDDEACDALSLEEVAKRKWLARLDVPSWGRTAATFSSMASELQYAQPTSINETSSGRAGTDSMRGRRGARARRASVEEAKRAWRARLDPSSWSLAAEAVADMAGEAAEVEDLSKQCASGVVESCDLLSREEEAKRRWLSRLDTRSWGAVATAISEAAAAAELDSLSAREEEARRRRLSRRDDGEV